jgi:hypothetical protein
MFRRTALSMAILATTAAALQACTTEVIDETELEVDVDDIVNPSGEEQALTMPRCGTVLASFDGTNAYSNGPNTGTGNSCAGQGGIANGLQYQCVELVMRHFKRKWNLRWYGNAKTLLRGAPRDTVDVITNGDRSRPPVPGDMIVWENGTYGHVALVVDVGRDYVDIIEQNVAGNGKARLSYRDGTVGARWNGWAPTGWAHAKQNTASGGGGGGATPPPTPPPTTNPGAPEGCGRLGVTGGVIDDDDDCLELGGTPGYLRAESGGFGGDHVWTTATSGTLDNFARWHLDVARAGSYRVDVHVPASATSRQTVYKVRHDGVVDDVALDQSAGSGWRSLGAFAFARGGDQVVRLNDNTGEASSLRRRIAFDGLRLVPACAELKVETGGATLNVRSSASAGATRLGTLTDAQRVRRIGSVDGSSVDGNTIWHEVEAGGLRGFASGAYLACP